MIQHNLRSGTLQNKKKGPELLKKGNFLEEITTKIPEIC
jgi:hypothetical protein